MNNRNAIIIGAIIIVMAIAVSVMVMGHDVQKETRVEIISGSALHEGDNVTVKLTDEDEKPVAGETVKITVANSNGWTKTMELKTDSNGTATFEITDTEPGNYTIECSYSGNDYYEGSNITMSVTIQENEVQTDSKVQQTTTTKNDPGAFYSLQGDRVIYTGEVHDAPDGNRYVHKGNNEWELVS